MRTIISLCLFNVCGTHQLNLGLQSIAIDTVYLAICSRCDSFTSDNFFHDVDHPSIGNKHANLGKYDVGILGHYGLLSLLPDLQQLGFLYVNKAL